MDWERTLMKGKDLIVISLASVVMMFVLSFSLNHFYIPTDVLWGLLLGGFLVTWTAIGIAVMLREFEPVSILLSLSGIAMWLIVVGAYWIVDPEMYLIKVAWGVATIGVAWAASFVSVIGGRFFKSDGIRYSSLLISTFIAMFITWFYRNLLYPPMYV